VRRARNRAGTRKTVAKRDRFLFYHMFLVCSEGVMRQSIVPAAFAAVLAAGFWHLPAAAQGGAGPQHQPAAAPSAAAASPASPRAAVGITFDEYRDFRLHYIAAREAGLARQLAAPGLAADEKTRLEGIKTYYDRLAAMPAGERDRLFRARFDQIDTNHDGRIDDAERAAWRAKQRRYFSELAAERSAAQADRR
jgi:hypothetical protein